MAALSFGGVWSSLWRRSTRPTQVNHGEPVGTRSKVTVTPETAMRVTAVLCAARVIADPNALRLEVERKADLLLAFQRSDQRRAAVTAAILWQAGEIAAEAGLIPETFPMAPSAQMLLDPSAVEPDDGVGAIDAENDLERLVKAAWLNATKADSAATDTTTKAVDTMIRNLVTGLGVTVADEVDGSTRDRQAFRLSMFKVPGSVVQEPVFVVPLQTLAKLTESPVEWPKIAKALEDRDALLLYPRAPGKDGRQRRGERCWSNVPGIGQVKSLIIPARALE